jgi:hypothetical protein
MIASVVRPIVRFALAAAFAAASFSAFAQETLDTAIQLDLPDLSGYAAPRLDAPLAQAQGQLTLAAQLIDGGPDITRGLVWRVFKPDPDSDGKLPLVASAQGGTSVLDLEPGSYLVHATFGRAGATKRIRVGSEAKRESLVLDAGGLKLNAVLTGGVKIPPKKLRFSIYEVQAGADEEEKPIIDGVKPNTVIRLSAGIYHVVSKYGSTNAIIRSDIRVEAGKLTEATVEHHAAELTLKLVREAGGEAIADTSWSVITDSGDPVGADKVRVGAYTSLVLSEGEYTIIAKNRDRIYQRDFTVVPGKNQEVEVLAKDGEPTYVDDDAAD